MVGATHLGLLLGLELFAYYGMEKLIDIRDPEYRETDVGSALEDHPVLRYLYVFVFMAWWATSINPAVQSVGMVFAMGVLGGMASSGWDMLLHSFVNGVRNTADKMKEAKEQAQQRHERESSDDEESEDNSENVEE